MFRSPRAEFSHPDPISALLDPDFSVDAVIESAQERADPPAPTHTVTETPLRRDAGGDGVCSPGALLAGFTGRATRKSGSAGHGPKSFG